MGVQGSETVYWRVKENDWQTLSRVLEPSQKELSMTASKVAVGKADYEWSCTHGA